MSKDLFTLRGFSHDVRCMGMHFVLVCGSHVWHLRQILGTANSGSYQIKDPNRRVQGFFFSYNG